MKKTLLTSSSPVLGDIPNQRLTVAKERSQIFCATKEVKPKVGSLLAVGLGFGLIEHTGIYVGDGYIVEQHGDDELRKVTLKEFMDGDGELYARGLNISIQIACDKDGNPLRSKKTAKKALKMYDDYTRRTKEYSLLFNNCHQFCWQCISGSKKNNIVLFSTLEDYVSMHFEDVIYWYMVKINVICK